MYYKLLDFENKEKVFNIIKTEKIFEYEEFDDFTCCSFYSIIDEDKNEVGFFGLESRQYALCFCYLYVFEEYRNKGYAKKAIDEMIKNFKDEYGYIYGFVSSKNEIALKLYKHYNFLHKTGLFFVNGFNFDKEKDELCENEGNYEIAFYYNKNTFDINQRDFEKNH